MQIITFVTPSCQRPRPGVKMSVENRILFRFRFGEPGGTHPPRISWSFYDFNSCVVLFGDLLILFYLTQNQIAQFLPMQSVVHIILIPSPCFIPSLQSVAHSLRSIFHTDHCLNLNFARVLLGFKKISSSIECLKSYK